MDTITIREYENLPVMTKGDYLYDRKKLNIDDLVVLCDTDRVPDHGDTVSVYKVIAIKDDGNVEFLPVLLKVE